MTARDRRNTAALEALGGLVKAAAGGASDGELLGLVGRGLLGLARGHLEGRAEELRGSASGQTSGAVLEARRGRGRAVPVAVLVDGEPVRGELVDAPKRRGYRPK